MNTLITQFVDRLRYGEAVVVVSGLPRSGTSMLMNMLQQGGLEVFADEQRTADEDNPLGYFELDRVKRLESDQDKAWLRKARGKAIKVVSHLLRALPLDNRYRVLLATRDLREVLSSQNRMLDRLKAANPVEDEKAFRLYERHLKNVRSLASVRSNFEMMEVPYAEVIEDVGLWSSRIATFIGREMNQARMAEVVDARLYRNRVEGLQVVHRADAGAAK
jgi:hypothetical protein